MELPHRAPDQLDQLQSRRFVSSGRNLPAHHAHRERGANAPPRVSNQAPGEGRGVADPASATDPTTIGANATPAAWTITKTHSGNFKQGQNGAVSPSRPEIP